MSGRYLKYFMIEIMKLIVSFLKVVWIWLDCVLQNPDSVEPVVEGDLQGGLHFVSFFDCFLVLVAAFHNADPSTLLEMPR